MSYAIEVLVIDKKTRKGLSGHRTKLYGGSEVKTDNKGKATLVAEKTAITVYVNGIEVYDGYVSSAPKPIIYEKG